MHVPPAFRHDDDNASVVHYAQRSAEREEEIEDDPREEYMEYSYSMGKGQEDSVIVDQWPENMHGLYALHAAAGNRDLRMLQWLVGVGVDMEAPNEADYGAAVVAIEEGHMDGPRLLLNLGLPVE